MELRVLLFLVFLHGGICEVKQDLGGRWTLKDETEEYKDLVATVPGGIYTDLMNENNKVLDDIYVGFNDVNYKWVARNNWTYWTTFQVKDDIGKRDVIQLVLEGVDTFSTIYINDYEVGSTENMFVRYIFDITDKIKRGDNNITVKFLSPISVSDDLAKKHEEDYLVPPECVPDSYQGECHVNYIRKVQASFSWDWGPAFPSVGIWKSIYLEAFFTTTIRYVVAEVIDDGENWLLSIDTYFEPSKKSGVTGTLDVSLDTKDGPIYLSENVTLEDPNEFGEVFTTANLTVPKASVDLWWPNGYGRQPLYSLNVTFTDDKESSTSQKKIGFRKIEIMQDELDSGLAFYFKVNNVSIFAMGVNVIPIDILPEKSYKKETVDYLFSAVAEYTEMNMLRVWGGGVYESDYFYDMADKYGLLIWQDFTFASAMYPANDEFLSNVKKEVNHQVKRIQSHPSLAVWGGNNENEGNLASNHFNTADNFDVYKADYIKLYIDTVRDETRRVTKNANFVDSSPTNGIQSDKEGYVAENPGSTFYGDSHYYTYDKAGFDEGIFPTPRFASEYGFQSLPSVSSWLTVANLSDLNINTDFMKHRQHHPIGNAPLKNFIELQMELPSEDNEYYDEAFIYYTQIVQAMSVKTESEHYRRFMGRFDDQGQGNTMGALFWQLNDVWVAPSWASIDYTGRWKMLHNFIPTFFSQELVTGHYNKDKKLEIYHMLNKPNVDREKWINLTVYSWDSFEPLNRTQFTGQFEPLTATLVATIDVDQYLSDSGCGSAEEAKTNCFVHIIGGANATALTPSNYFFPSKLKEAKLKTSNVEILAVDQIDGKGLLFLVAIKADAPSLFVWLDAHDIKGHFLENGFIQHTLVTAVIFKADSPTTSDDLKKVLTVTHLRDPKYFP